MSVRRRWLAVAAAVALGGCLDYEETIRVHTDGSVEISVYATVVQGALPLLRHRPELQTLLMLPTSKRDARKLLPADIGVRHWVIADGAGVRIYDLAVTVPSISQVGLELESLLGGQEVRLFLDDAETIQYRRQVPPYPMDAAKKLMGESLEARLQNSRMSFRLIVPTEIVETNGILVDSQEVVWKTDLWRLREHGVLMAAKVRTPGLWERHPGAVVVGAGVGALLLAGTVVWLRRRRL